MTLSGTQAEPCGARVGDRPGGDVRVRALAAARTGQELNLSALANDTGVTQQTIRRWLNALEVGYLVTTLPRLYSP